MPESGQSSARTLQEPVRPVLAICLTLLGLDVGMHAVLFSRLPQTIAVHRSVTGVVDNAGHRDLVWLGPTVHAFVVALWLVSPKHITQRERRLAAAVIPLASLYLPARAPSACSATSATTPGKRPPWTVAGCRSR